MLEQGLILYGESAKRAWANAVVDGLLESDTHYKDFYFIFEEISDIEDVKGGTYPPPKGLSEEENLRTHSALANRQMRENKYLRKIDESDRK